ncbi:MAG: hypothetical protein MRT15_10095 [archaeon YNP-LCB-003-016]|uniref:hypothetical protein n=1 Tax=Candidatus Culexarchaeum yellowstonense TaxID=2928963 RepID=UPI0026EB0AF6|nr:hypothetical protein [Candidatus Culexarchaeum yellowstonense]MCR6692732.1 hypothetical protein [Candidatus Culexarchaeum yellowstonense]
MGRLRIVMKPRFIGFEVEEEVYELLRRIAFERKTTLSSAAREILHHGLRSMGLLGGPETNDKRVQVLQDPPCQQTDLIVSSEIEEFNQELDDLDVKVDLLGDRMLKVLDKVERQPRDPKDIRSYTQDEREILRLVNQIHLIEEEIRRATNKYYKLKKQASHEQLKQIQTKLYNIKYKHSNIKQEAKKIMK